MPIWENKKSIGIWGAGREGKSAYKFLCQKCPDAEITFLSDTNLDDVDGLSGQEALQKISSGDFDLLIKSPGISLYRTEIAAAKQAGTMVSSTTNLWFENYPAAKTIAVTGTKGKTTVASMIDHMLSSAGVETVLAGNIGAPLLETVPGKQVTVIELSSYQIADLAFGPDIAVFTSLYPEHVPWHRSLEQYYQDKLRLGGIDTITKIVANSQDAELKARLPQEEVVWVKNPDTQIPIKGAHNQLNAALAAAAIKTAGFDIQEPFDHLQSFAMPPHRLEEIGVFQGMLCVNDSISTVPQATLAALETYKDRSIILILGGEDRGQAYEELAMNIPDYNIRHVFALPDTQAKIMTALEESVEVTACDDLKQAVAKAFKVGHAGDVLLLSPAAPSYNQFKDFEHRGEAFRQYCRLYA